MTGRSRETQSIEKRGIEVDRSDKVTIPQSRIELESKEDKERGKGELNRTTTPIPGVRDYIAKAHKLIKEEVIAASFGRVV